VGARAARSAGDVVRGSRPRRGAVHRSHARRSSRFINLGTVRFLRGRYAEAAAVFRQALEIDPGQYTALIDLADAENELGHPQEAAGLYRQTLARIEENERTVGLPPDDGMIKAECLARLGRPREAAALAQEILRRSPDERDLLYEAALVYSLVGDRNSALGNAQAALEKGESPRLFTGSAFRPLLDGPELPALLAAASRSGSSEAHPAASSGSALPRSSAP
jgi:tetratricopeptide (TPR) repeat protein